MDVLDVNNSSPVVTDTGVVEQVAAAPVTTDVSQPVPGDGVPNNEGVPQEAAAAPAEQQVEQAVPYDRFKTVNDEKNTFADENAQLKEHISLLSSQQPAQQPQQSVQPQKGLTEQVMEQMGIDPDYATPIEIAKVNDAVWEIRSTQVTAQNQASQFQAAHSDYASVVGANDPATGQFVYAQPLLRAMQADPGLAADLQAAGTGAGRLAYKIAVNDPTYRQALADANPTPATTGAAVETAVAAAAGMTSISAVGSAGVIDKSAQIAQMTDAEHKAHTDKIKQAGGIAF